MPVPVADGIIGWWTWKGVEDLFDEIAFPGFPGYTGPSTAVIEDVVGGNNGHISNGSRIYLPFTGGPPFPNLWCGTLLPTAGVPWRCARDNIAAKLDYVFTGADGQSENDPQTGHNSVRGATIPKGAFNGSNFTFATWVNPSGPYDAIRFDVDGFNPGPVPNQVMFGDMRVDVSTNVGWDVRLHIHVEPVADAAPPHAIHNRATGPVDVLMFQNGNPSLSFGSYDLSSPPGWFLIVITCDGETLKAYRGSDFSSIALTDSVEQTSIASSASSVFTFGHHDNTGAGDDGYPIPYNGAWDETLIWNRALTAQEIKKIPTACDLIARIHKKIPVSVQRTALPVPTRPVGEDKQGKSENGAAVGKEIAATTTGFQLLGDYPPSGHNFPPYPLVNRYGASVFSCQNNNQGSGIMEWPSNTWVTMEFPFTEFVFNFPFGGSVREVGCDFPDVEKQMAFEFPAWWGPLELPDNPPVSGDTHAVESFVHWKVKYSEMVPPVFTGPFDPDYTLESFLIDPVEWTTNTALYPHVKQGNEFVTTHGKVEFVPPNPDFYISTLWYQSGQILLPNKADWGFGWDFAKTFKRTSFQARLRETTTNTVVGLYKETGSDLNLFTTGVLRFEGRSNIFVPGALDPQTGEFTYQTQSNLVNVPQGKRFVCEVWQGSGSTLHLPVWGSFSMYGQTHFPGMNDSFSAVLPV